jgi:very-short-patch-repair endonuclease
MTDILIQSKKAEMFQRFEKRLAALFQKCESPIEKLFFAYLYDYGDQIHYSKIEFITKEIIPVNEGTDKAYFDESFDFQECGVFFKIVGLRLIDTDMSKGTNTSTETTTLIYPQYNVQYNEAQYRLDFAVIIERDNKVKRVNVECDGHEFHSTKEQITRDNQRMRNLSSMGWQTFKYSGSELFADTWKCIRDFERNAIYGTPNI